MDAAAFGLRNNNKNMKQVIKKIAIITGAYRLLSARRDKKIREKKLTDAKEEIKFYSGFLSKGDLCFDVGANLGYKADVFFALGAKVVCVEPQPDCVKILNRHFKNNKDVIIVDKGLADKPGELELSICEQAPTITTMSDKWKKEGRFANDFTWDKKINVKVDTLDNLINKYGVPRFCKIDVEGFEESVLKGLTKPIPFISFEFTNEFFTDAKKILDHLSSIGKIDVNCALYDHNRLFFDEYLSKEAFYDKIGNMDENLLNGDIYVRFL
jgi:FkbM family methyltransferase